MARIRFIGALATLVLAITAIALAFPAAEPSTTAARSAVPTSEQVQRREPWYLDFRGTQQVQRREPWYLDFRGGQEIPRREQWYLDFPGK